MFSFNLFSILILTYNRKIIVSLCITFILEYSDIFIISIQTNQYFSAIEFPAPTYHHTIFKPKPIIHKKIK